MVAIQHQLPYGTWPSPVSAELVASGALSFHDLQAHGSKVSWIEQRPDEGGRGVIVAADSKTDTDPVDVLPAPWSARSRVYAYGGGAFTTDGTRYWFCNDVNASETSTDGDQHDQRIHVVIPGHQPSPLTPRVPFRYGDLTFDPHHRRIVAVREDWQGAVDGLPRVELVSVDAMSGDMTTLASGADFYAAPSVSPDGSELVWLEWDWPFMPWDATRLMSVRLGETGAVAGRGTFIAGGSSESIAEPRWSPDGVLHFVSDRSGWASIYKIVDRCVAVVAAADETEWTAPNWGLGVHTYSFEPGGRLWAAHVSAASWSLGVVGRKSTAVETETAVAQVAAGDGYVAYVAAGPKMVPTVSVRRGRHKRPQRLRNATVVDDSILATVSKPLSITFKTTGGAKAHAFFYPPHNPGAIGPDDERFPVVIRSHGGPSAATSSGLDLETQFFTSRGFGVVDVNYRGSTGFGRAYLLSLYGQWGIVDRDDCAAAAAAVAAKYGGDQKRIVARGGSAGGYATNCLATFTDVLAAGASYYGISDLIELVKNTENFERHYVDELVAPRPGNAELYRTRSPIDHADLVRCPMAFYQGAEDPVVPPDQTKRMVEALRSRGIDVVFMLFTNEQHGFRIAAHLIKALESEIAFYAKHLGFELPAHEPVEDSQHV